MPAARRAPLPGCHRLRHCPFGLHRKQATGPVDMCAAQPEPPQTEHTFAAAGRRDAALEDLRRGSAMPMRAASPAAAAPSTQKAMPSMLLKASRSPQR